MQKRQLLPVTLAFMLMACATPPGHQANNTNTYPESMIAGTITATTSTEQADLQNKLHLPEKTADSADTAQDYTDIWQRIRENLVLNRHVENRTVRERIAWYARNQEYLDRVSERAAPYIYYIVEELDKRDMPLDIALLPVVESAYQPFAYSRSHASGIWQFIPGTGSIYGLKQNWWYDGRRDIVEATRAALDYLQKLNNQFNGDWELALAAYNSGERNVERAIEKNHRNRKDTDFFSLGLPRETRGYVPSLLAVAEIIAHPQKYNLSLKPVANQPYFSRVNTGGQLDLSTAAKLSGLTIDEVYTLNPGFNRWATDPDGPHYLLLPLDREQQFLQGLDSLADHERVAWSRHIIREGETLSQIASRYRTSIAAIRETNNIHGNLIRAGHSLLIPSARQPGEYYTLSHDNRNYRGLQPGDDQATYIYTVRNGDNLWDISRRYDTTVNNLRSWNGLGAQAILRPGQKLNIRVAATDQQDTQVTAMSTARSYTLTESGEIHYTVQKGDSLWLISRNFGVTVAQIQQWNRLKNSKQIHPGQTLVLMNTAAPATDV